VQTLIDRGYDPLAYRYFCLSGHYRTKLSFSWVGLDGAETALNRLRMACFSLGKPSNVDTDFLEQFTVRINNDLNMPQALALTWDLIKSDLHDATKKATILKFDEVLGLRLKEWRPAEEKAIPEEIMSLVEERQRARTEKNWQKADALRDQICEAGYELMDTPDGPKIKATSR
jgi:cysteinyl-tRNA synthetase